MVAQFETALSGQKVKGVGRSERWFHPFNLGISVRHGCSHFLPFLGAFRTHSLAVKGEACKPREIARCGAVPVKPTRAEPASPPVVGFLLFGGDEDEQGTRGENQGCERENQFVD